MNTHESDQQRPLEPEGRRARKARLTRRAMLDAGLAAFERQPFGLVSVLDITDAADVAKGVFYLHFASKDDFLLALADDVQQRFLAQVVAALSAVQVQDDALRARVATAIGEYARAAVDTPQSVYFALRMASYVGEEIGPPGELERRRSAYLQQLAQVIDGSGGDQPMHPASYIVVCRVDAFCWGLIWQTLQLGEPPPTPDDLVAMVLPAVSSVLDGV